MKILNKNYSSIRWEDLDIGMEHTIKAKICVTTKYGKNIVIMIVFKSEMVDLFSRIRFDSKAADFENRLKD